MRYDSLKSQVLRCWQKSAGISADACDLIWKGVPEPSNQERSVTTCQEVTRSLKYAKPSVLHISKTICQRQQTNWNNTRPNSWRLVTPVRPGINSEFLWIAAEVFFTDWVVEETWWTRPPYHGFLLCDATHSVVWPRQVVCPSVTLRCHDHIGWNSAKIISRLWLISLTFFALCRPQHDRSTPNFQREHPRF